MTQFEAVQFVEDCDDDAPSDWLLKVSAIESMDAGTVSLSFVEVDDRDRESGAFVWVRTEELRGALDRIDAMMAAAARVADDGEVPPSAPSLSVVE